MFRIVEKFLLKYYILHVIIKINNIFGFNKEDIIMNFLRKLKVKTKLVSSYVIFALLIAVVSLIGIQLQKNII